MSISPTGRPRTITVTWRAFHDKATPPASPETSATIHINSDLDDLDLCEAVFESTNLYQGPIWAALEPVLPQDRTHTALSVVFGCGDHVTIDGATYEVAAFGFTRIDGQHSQ